MKHSKLPHMTPCDKTLFIYDENGMIVGMIIEEYRPAVILACNHFDEMREVLQELVALPGLSAFRKAASLLAKLEVPDAE